MDAKDIVHAIAEQFKDGDIMKSMPDRDQSDVAREEDVTVETFEDEGIQETDHGLTVYSGDRTFRITVDEL